VSRPSDYLAAASQKLPDEGPVTDPSLVHSTMVGTQLAPDTAGKIKHLSQVSGIPEDVVARNFDQVHKKVTADQIPVQAIQQQSPVLAKQLKDPGVMAMSQDELPHLGFLDHTLQILHDVTFSAVSGVESGIGGFLRGAPAIAEAAQRLPGTLPISPLTMPLALAGKALQTAPGKPWWYTQGNAIKAAGEQVSSLAQRTAIPENRQNIVTKTSAAVGQFVPLLAASILGGPEVGAVMMASQSAAESEAQSQPDNAPQYKKDLETLTAAGIGGVLGLVDMSILIKKLPLSIRNKVVRELADIAAAGGIQALYTAVQSLLLETSRHILTNPDQKIGENLAAETAQGGLTGVVMTMLMSAIGIRAESHFAVRQENLKTITKAVTEAKLTERSPEAMRQFIADHAVAAGKETVYVAPEKVEEYFQGKGVDPALAMNDVMVGGAEKFNEAKATGADLAIPFADYEVKLAPEHGTFFDKEIRFDPTEMSFNEAAEWAKEERAAIEALASGKPLPELGASAEKIKQDILGQISQRYSPGAAEANAGLQAWIYQTLAANYGVDPFVLYAKYQPKQGNQINFPLPSILKQAGAIDHLDVMLDRIRRNDFPSQGELYGKSLVEWLRGVGGVRDFGGDLASLEPDKGLKPFTPNLIQPAKGMELDLAVTRAIEEGYLPEGSTINDLINSVDQEIRGEAVYAQSALENPAAQEAIQLRALAEYLKTQDIEITKLSNDQIKKLLEEAAKIKTNAEGAVELFQLAKENEPRGFGSIAKHLTPEESAKLRTDSAQKLADLFKALPPDADFEAAALAGEAKKGWYAKSAEAIRQIFGDQDAPRFAALLAAMSPQTSVEINLLNAATMWRNWTRAGRPTDREAIIDLMGQSVQGGRGRASVLDAWVNNSVRALGDENPMATTLSGPKVDSFMRNLLGNVQAVTLDAWMANFTLLDQTVFGGSLTKGGDPGKGAAYLAMSAKIRRVAENLTKSTGKKWTPAEVQETVWSWAKTAYELAASKGETRTVEDLVKSGAITDSMIAATPDFATMLTKDVKLRALLEGAGYGPVLSAIESTNRERVGRNPKRPISRIFNQAAEAAAGLLRSARRLDRLAKQRATESKTYFQSVQPNAQGFFSQLESVVMDKFPNTTSPDQAISIIKSSKNGVRAEEIKWSGIESWLRAHEGKVTKQEVLDFLRANAIQVTEITHGDVVSPERKRLLEESSIVHRALADINSELRVLSEQGGREAADKLYAALERKRALEIENSRLATRLLDLENPVPPTKYEKYTLPGQKENYRELLLTLPTKTPPLPEERAKVWFNANYAGEKIMGVVRPRWVTDEYHLSPNGTIVIAGEDGHKFLVPQEVREKGGVETFASSHFDEPNILAHVRFDDRTDANGKRVLMVEEVQSDWHQTGRQKGYVSPETKTQYLIVGKRNGSVYRQFDTRAEAEARIQQFDELTRDGLVIEERTRPAQNAGGVPDAPFKTTWPELVMKRMVRYAAENGYDSVAWTTGEQQAKRYNLANHVDTLYWIPETGSISASKNGEEVFTKDDVTPGDLADIVGVEIARKLISNPTAITKNQHDETLHVLNGVDMNVGGEGMKTFYDEFLPRTMEKLGKKYGAEVGKTTLQGGTGRYEVTKAGDGWYEVRDFNTGKVVESFQLKGQALEWMKRNPPVSIEQPVHNMPITESMREAAMQQGFPLFQGKEKIPRGSTVFNADGTINMNLFARADLSTFLHETGHTFLGIMGDLVDDLKTRDPENLSVTQQQMVKDWNAILRYLGVDSRADIGEDQHEKFAKSFEAYLREGKAPSIETRSMFATFKSWLVGLYADVKRRLGVELNPEIRDVFDRMIATSEAIDAAKAEAEITQLFLTRDEAPTMSDIEWVAYQKKAIEVTQKAKDALELKALRDYQKQHAKWWKEEEAAVRVDIARDIESRPEYQALHALKNNTAPNGEPLNIPPVKLDLNIIKQMFGKKSPIVEQVNRLGIARLDGGIDPDLIARRYGYSSGQELVEALVGARPMDPLIDAEAHQEMIRRHGDIAVDGTVHDQARSAVMGKYRDDVVRLEMKALIDQQKAARPSVLAERERQEAERAYERRWFEAEAKLKVAIAEGQKQAVIDSLTAEAAKARAEQIAARRGFLKDLRAGQAIPTADQLERIAEDQLADTRVGDVNPSRFWSGARKASRVAIEATAKGDLTGAIKAKGQELLNLELFRQATEIRKTLADAREKALKMFKPDAKLEATREMDLVNAARAIAAHYLFPDKASRVQQALDLLKEYDPERHQDVLDRLPVLMNDGRVLRDLTVSEFKGVMDIIDELWTSSRREKQLLIEGRLVQANLVRDELRARMDKFKGGWNKYRTDHGHTKWETVSGMRAVLRRIESWTVAMDGGPDGPFRKYIWDVLDGPDAEYRIKRLEFLLRNDQSLEPIRERLTNTKIPAAEIGYTFKNHSELLGFLTHIGNREGPTSNYWKLVRGGRGPEGAEWGRIREDGTLDDTKVQAMLDRMMSDGTIVKADLDYVQSLWDLFEDLKPGLQASHREIKGSYFNEVTATPFTTPWGDYRGGYVPAKADPILSEEAGIQDIKRVVGESNNSFSLPGTGSGATKQRVNVARPLQLGLGYVPSHIDWALRYTYFEPRVRDIYRLVKDKEFTYAMKDLDPSFMQRALIPWLRRVATQRIAEMGLHAGLMDKLLNGLQRGAAMNTLTLSVTNALHQLVGIPIAKTHLPMSALLGSTMHMMVSPKEAFGRAHDLSSYMRMHNSTETADLIQDFKHSIEVAGAVERGVDSLQRHGMILRRITAGFVETMVWNAGYDNAKAHNRTNEQAVRDADSIVRQTQHATRPIDVAAYESGTPLVRLMLMFSSWFNNVGNNAATQIGNAWRSDAPLYQRAGRAVSMYTFGIMLPSVMAQAILNMVHGHWKDDDESDLMAAFDLVIGSQFKMGTAMIPGFGQALNVFAQAATDIKKPEVDDIRLSPTISMTTAAAAALHSAVKRDVTSGTYEVHGKEISDTLKFIGMLSKLPLGVLGSPARFLKDISDFKAFPQGPGDYVRGLISGSIPKR
jgi:hypothetical protein